MAAYNYIIDTGAIVADTDSIQSDVQTEWRAALGAGLDVSASTSQGTLINSETQARAFVMNNNAMLGNQLNPDLALGVYLDSIGALMGINRGVNTPTVLQVNLTGATGTVVRQGSRILSPSGATFTANDNYTLPTVGAFSCDSFGPTPVDVGATMSIIDGTIGWLGATNQLTALGKTAMSDAQFKVFRNQTLFRQSRNSVQAVYSNLLSQSGVVAVRLFENRTSALKDFTAAGQSIRLTKPHSFWICVDNNSTSLDPTNSDNIAIAQNIHNSLSTGCDMGGANDISAGTPGTPIAEVTVNVVDSASGQTYDYTFSKPTSIRVEIDAVVNQLQGAADYLIAAQNAVIAYINGQLVNNPGFVVGCNVSPFEIAGAIVAQVPGTLVRDCTITVHKGTPTAQRTEWLMLPWEKPLTVGTDIRITAG